MASIVVVSWLISSPLRLVCQRTRWRPVALSLKGSEIVAYAVSVVEMRVRILEGLLSNSEGAVGCFPLKRGFGWEGFVDLIR